MEYVKGILLALVGVVVGGYPLLTGRRVLVEVGAYALAVKRRGSTGSSSDRQGELRLTLGARCGREDRYPVGAVTIWRVDVFLHRCAERPGK